MKFEYYVLNYDHNKEEVINFNIFDNIVVQEYCEKAVKKYLRAPRKYKFVRFGEPICYGFEAFCKEIDSIIRWQEWSRFEYEISVGSLLDYTIKDVMSIVNDTIKSGKSIIDLNDELKKNMDKRGHFSKWDCYKQCRFNIPIIAREIIYQYKEQIKESKNEH